jgi:hypothetical protein
LTVEPDGMTAFRRDSYTRCRNAHGFAGKLVSQILAGLIVAGIVFGLAAASG